VIATPLAVHDIIAKKLFQNDYIKSIEIALP
jgi:hypothetical protein